MPCFKIYQHCSLLTTNTRLILPPKLSKMQSPQMLFDSLLGINVISGCVREYCGEWRLECWLLLVGTGTEHPLSFIIIPTLFFNEKKKQESSTKNPSWCLTWWSLLKSPKKLTISRHELTVAQEFLQESQKSVLLSSHDPSEMQKESRPKKEL